MKRSTQIIHSIILFLLLDDFIAAISLKIPILKKFIPGNSRYKKGNIKRIKRNGITYELEVSDYMQWHIYAGIKEPLWTESFKYIRPGTVVIDVGANVGAFSLRCAAYVRKARLNSRIFSFEPNPEVYKKLCFNLNLNPVIDDFISPQELALCDKKDIWSFDANEFNSGAGKLTTRGDSYSVISTTLDSFIEENEIKPITLIKIDVEGFEPLVLKGGFQTIALYRPVLILEITDQWFQIHGSSEAMVRNDLMRMGYNLFIDSGEGLRELRDQDKSSDFQYNLMALPF